MEREEVAGKAEVEEKLGSELLLVVEDGAKTRWAECELTSLQTTTVSDAWRDHFFLPTEEYLHSLISLLNELVRLAFPRCGFDGSSRCPVVYHVEQSRLAVNRVTLGDYAAPVQYSR